MAVDQVKTKFAQFDQATIASHVVVAGVAGKTVKIKCLHLYSVGVNEVDIRSDGNDLAEYPLIAQDQILLPMIGGSQERYFTTGAGEAFRIALSAALRVTGFVVYEQS